MDFQYYLDLNSGRDQYRFTETIAVASLHIYLHISMLSKTTV